MFRFIPLLWAVSVLAAAEHRGVVSSAGQPIPGASVTAIQGEKKLVTTTDESGKYVFEDLPPGAWIFQVEMFGFQTARREIVIVTEDSASKWELEMGRAETPGSQAESEVLAEMEEPPAAETERLADEGDANEAFLVQGSLSRSLEPARPPAKPEAKAGPRRIKPDRRAAAKRQRAMAFGNRRARERREIRGSVFVNWRNSALDARSFSLSGQSFAKPSYAQSRFGVMAGGPLFERTLFTLNCSGTRSRNPFDAVATLPTPAERAGDFAGSFVRGPVTVYDPATRLPFPGNQAPRSRVNPAAAGLLAFIPAPNQPGRIHNYQLVSQERQNSDTLSLRLNQPLSRRNRLSFSSNLQRRRGDNLQVFGFRDESSGSGWRTDLGWTYNLKRHLVSNLRWSFNRNRSATTPFFAHKRNVAAELGIRGASEEPVNWGPPNLSFTNFADLRDASPLLRREQNSGLSESLTVIKGRHNVTAGGEYRRIQLNSRTDQNARGSFTFSGLATSGFDERNQPLPFSGFDFADFLLGRPQSSSVRFGGANTYFRGASWAAFAQDDWRVRPNLSVNAGLRYELFPPLREKFGHMANLDIAAGFTGAAVVTPGAGGPYSGRFPDALIDPDRNNLSPRVGLAWRPLGKRQLLVRAGYGAFHDGSIYARFATRLASQPPFANTAQLTSSLARPLTLQDGLAATPSTKVTNTFAVDRSYRVGYAQSWNLSVQQELPNAFVLEAGYLGTKGTRLDIQRSPNRAAPGSPLTAEQRRQIGNAVGFVFDSSEGNSIYHAAQVRMTRRFHRGFSTNALYTWSKSIDNASTIGGGGATVAQNDNDLRAERGLSSFDQRHALTLYYLISSPVGAGVGLLGGDGILPRLLRNWTLGGGLTLHSGQPFTARVLGNRADSGGTGVVGSGRADSSGAAVAPAPGERFFNLDAFVVPPPGRFGNAGRNTVPGPGLFTLNLSLGRSFRLGEGRRWLEFRLESNNFTNHVNYTRLETVVNSLNYGLATQTAPMRAMTAWLRYRF